jgi:hypothetical protein
MSLHLELGGSMVSGKWMGAEIEVAIISIIGVLGIIAFHLFSAIDHFLLTPFTQFIPLIRK